MERVGQLRIPSFIYISNAVEVSTSPGIQNTLHPGMIPATFFEEGRGLLPMGIYGSGPFEGAVMDAFRRADVQHKDIHREGFDSGRRKIN